MKKVLIIDDEPLIRRTLKKALESIQSDPPEFQIQDAVNGLEGLQLWEQNDYDLVFLDVLMPGLTGPQVLEKISADKKSRTYIVIISAYAGEYSKDSVHQLGAHDFIAKPFPDIISLVGNFKKILYKNLP